MEVKEIYHLEEVSIVENWCEFFNELEKLPPKLFVVTAIPKGIIAIPNNSILIPFIANTFVTNLNLYNYSSNFPYFTGFPACSLVK